MKKQGMTIAETLITLIIVGVVGALCIPSIISSYRKESYSSLLSSAVVNFETAMTTMVVKENCDSLFETRAWNFVGDSALNNTSSDANKLEFAGYVDTHIGLLYNENLSDVEDVYDDIEVKSIEQNVINVGADDIWGETVPYIAKNGTVYFIRIQNGNNDPIPLQERDVMVMGGNLSRTAADVIIDINGNKKPNIVGRDIFGFALGAEGNLYPMGGIDYAIKYSGSTNAWNRADSEYACSDDNKAKNGFGCTARLIENKYKMDY